MKSLKYSLSIKTLCYILVPILLVMLLASVFAILYVAEHPDSQKEEINIQLREDGKIEYYSQQQWQNTIAKYVYDRLWLYLPVSVLGLIMAFVYLFSSIGHKEGQEEIYLGSFEKIPTELALIIIGILYMIAFRAFWGMYREANTFVRQIIIIGFSFIPFYLITILYLVTILRRLKAHTFWKNSICYRIIKGILEVFDSIRLTIKVAIGYTIFAFATAVFLLQRYNQWNILLLIAMWGVVGIYLLKKAIEYYKIRDFIQALYEGEEVEALEEKEFHGEYKKIVPQLNDISFGFSNAIEKGIQSERLKTELITNVSHDIKTPLTSIINYVDLMKKEEIENEKIKEYLEVLDKKSQRLKKLTEDLVEASKASSGNIKLNKENVNVKELIIQEIGEFDERFREKKLEIITDLPEENIMLYVDGKYMARVLDNVFSNISKYALPNSRVYVDVKRKQNQVEMSFKNISEHQLNITADELMERFVRGDVARTTEGSGLGLSIAQSLTELQGGTFSIYLDGDLFKVLITF